MCKHDAAGARVPAPMLQKRSSMVGTIAAVLVVALIAWIGATNSWTRARRQANRRQRRRERREARLEAACCARDRHVAIATLVDQLYEADPEEVSRLELDTLLDRHAELLLDRRRLADALAYRTREPRIDTTSPARIAVHEREQAWRSACAQRIFTIDDQLGGIEELIKLYCEQATLPDLESVLGDEDRLERRLAIVDAQDGVIVEVA